MSSSGDSAADLRFGRVEANGIDFGVLEAGSGPLALCLHGFPDSAQTWRHLLPELARAGFRGASSDPNGGPLAVQWQQASIILAGGAALGLIGTLVPAALVGRARLTTLAGLRE